VRLWSVSTRGCLKVFKHNDYGIPLHYLREQNSLKVLFEFFFRTFSASSTSPYVKLPVDQLYVLLEKSYGHFILIISHLGWIGDMCKITKMLEHSIRLINVKKTVCCNSGVFPSLVDLGHAKSYLYQWSSYAN
jgi:hypothetical protein